LGIAGGQPEEVCGKVSERLFNDAAADRAEAAVNFVHLALLSGVIHTLSVAMAAEVASNVLNRFR